MFSIFTINVKLKRPQTNLLAKPVNKKIVFSLNLPWLAFYPITEYDFKRQSSNISRSTFFRSLSLSLSHILSLFACVCLYFCSVCPYTCSAKSVFSAVFKICQSSLNILWSGYLWNLPEKHFNVKFELSIFDNIHWWSFLSY